MTKYVLGVDGGGTKTDYLLFDTEGNMKAHLRGAGTNHEGLAGGMEELEKNLNEVLPPFLRANGMEPSDLAGAVFGMAGVDVPSQKAALEGMFTRMGMSIDNIRVMNDSFIGIKAGSRRGYGICVVNGTGNTVGGIDRTGKWLQVAGTGYVSNEVGGAGRLADRALRAVYREHFSLGERTAMTPLIMGLLSIDDPVYYIEALYQKYHTRLIKSKDILDVLFKCANEGDAVAVGILKHVGGQIARNVAGCERLLDMGPAFDVVLVGSVTLKASCPILLDTLKSEVLRLTGKQVAFIPLTVPAAVGAVLWAIELALGRLADDTVTQRTIDAVSKVV